MKPRFRGIRAIISACRLIPHLFFLAFGADRSTFQEDLYRWAEIHRLTRPSDTWQRITQFVMFMTFTKEFRNIFYLRFGPASKIFAWLCPRLESLDIAPAPIGPGLFIQHGEGTYVSAESIGRNCWIGRQVVIGYSNETDRPVIGNDVRILAGAKIIGQVRIGDGATIGLNTVIMQDVPAGVTMLGIPGKIIWKANPAIQDSDFRTLRAVN